MIDKALRAAGSKLPLRSTKARNEMLAYAAMDMAEAYQIGAEEAQSEVIRRLEAIRRTLQPDTPAPVGHLEARRDADAEHAQRQRDRIAENPRD
ncbi:MAG TPA: hypothetical protein VN750_26020 [Steroidobacteraceae bacterium]|nr:hypothetical protein [Steroidobacteraceae bacterium]